MVQNISLDELVHLLKTEVTKKDIIGNGGYASVYGMQKCGALCWSTYKYAVKVYRMPMYDNITNDAKREYSVAQELYATGISVPTPFGIASLPNEELPLFLQSNYYFSRPFLFMEYVKATPYKQWTTEEKKLIQDLYRIQRELVRNLGYITYDSAWDYNLLFDRKQKKIYLNDFVDWRKRCNKI